MAEYHKSQLFKGITKNMAFHLCRTCRREEVFIDSTIVRVHQGLRFPLYPLVAQRNRLLPAIIDKFCAA
ncbi:hypothetical protein CE195_07295, partial [Sodalis-like symbiont of Philaenus spumarius]